MIHSCDLSTPTRKFDTLRTWTYLLFEEFFHQGDVEKAQGQPASFLCDRETTIVAKEQPGFCNFIVIPAWKVVSALLPRVECAEQRARQNVQNWQQHEETEEERRVYSPKPGKLEAALPTPAINSA